MNFKAFDYNVVAQRLKKVLEQIPGKNIDEKSQSLNCSTPSLYSYLSGKTRFPLEFLVILQNVTSIDLNWLLTGQGNQFGQGDEHPSLSLSLFHTITDQLTARLEAESITLPPAQLTRKVAMIYNLMLKFGQNLESPDPNCIDQCIALALG